MSKESALESIERDENVNDSEALTEDIVEELPAVPTIQPAAPLRQTASSVASDISPGIDPNLAKLMNIEEFSSLETEDVADITGPETNGQPIAVVTEPNPVSAQESKDFDSEPTITGKDDLETTLELDPETITDKAAKDETGMVLSMLAAPRNWLPQSHRYLVDVAAISLACWVPIAWGFAFFSPPSNESPRIEFIPEAPASLEEGLSTNSDSTSGKDGDRNFGSE